MPRDDATAANDPAPSRYPLRVGDIAVLVVSDGVVPLPAASFATNADPADRAAWLAESFLPPDVVDTPLNVAVVRSGGRTVLIDAGLGDVNPAAPRAGRLADRLRAAAADPADLTDVVLTHLHLDHVGGLLADGLRNRLRPDLRVHLAAAEADFWAAPDLSRTAIPPPLQDVVRAVAGRFLDAYRDRLRPFHTEYEVAPGVTVVRTGGHTPGHSVVRLASGGERLTFAGDAVFPVSFARPGWHNGFDTDPDEAARVRVELLRELAAAGDPLIATHLSFPAVGRVAAAGDGFRWVPAVWAH